MKKSLVFLFLILALLLLSGLWYFWNDFYRGLVTVGFFSPPIEQLNGRSTNQDILNAVRQLSFDLKSREEAIAALQQQMSTLKQQIDSAATDPNAFGALQEQINNLQGQISAWQKTDGNQVEVTALHEQLEQLQAQVTAIGERLPPEGQAPPLLNLEGERFDTLVAEVAKRMPRTEADEALAIAKETQQQLQKEVAANALAAFRNYVRGQYSLDYERLGRPHPRGQVHVAIINEFPIGQSTIPSREEARLKKFAAWHRQGVINILALYGAGDLETGGSLANVNVSLRRCESVRSFLGISEREAFCVVLGAQQYNGLTQEQRRLVGMVLAIPDPAHSQHEEVIKLLYSSG